MLISDTARATATSLAVALAMLTSLPASAGTSQPGGAAGLHVQLAGQPFKAMPRNTGPVRPIAPQHMAGKPGAGAAASQGCHDGASQTSYEGPCDHHPEYEATGGCESDAEQASVPGNCPNSSEP